MKKYPLRYTYNKIFFVVLVLVMAIAIGLNSCASIPEDPQERAEYEQTNDIFEPTNRYIFAVNNFLDFLLLRPLADTYNRLMPEVVHKRVRNVLSNLGESKTFINTLLQARFSDSLYTLGRFVINTTFGIGGMFDVAGSLSSRLTKKQADFGQTLYTYGIGEGPYIMLPLFGPSNVRDSIGTLVDSFGDPVSLFLGYYPPVPQEVDSSISYGRMSGGAITARRELLGQLDSLQKSSFDFYAQIRSITRQRRRAQLGISQEQFRPQEIDPFESEETDPFEYFEDFEDEDFEDLE